MHRHSVRPTTLERDAALPGDELLSSPDVVMDRAFTLGAAPEVVWPWLVQLGKRRAGWYLPSSVERVVPPARRGLRHLEPALLDHHVGDVIPDWGGRDATFTLAAMEQDSLLLYTSRRGRTELTWCLLVSPGNDVDTDSRVHLRLRLGPVRHRRLAEAGGGLVDLLTVAGLAAGLEERVHSQRV